MSDGAKSHKLLKTTLMLDTSMLLRALATISDPRESIERFSQELLGLARARQRALDVGPSSSLAFVLDVLLPLRTRGLARYLTSAVRTRTLEDFLRCQRGLTFALVEGAGDADALAEAVADALDSLHGYVLAHGLVDDAYLVAERALAKRLAGGTDNEPNGELSPSRSETQHDRAGDHELALAA